MELPAITSSQNRQVSLVRRYWTRPRECRREGVLVADGIHLVQEALKVGLRCRSIFATVGDRDPEIAAILGQSERLRLPVYRVLDHIFRAISPVETPQGILGVFDRPKTERVDLWGRDRARARGHLVVCHGLQDPGNIGALTRSALAAGLGGLITSPGTVDPFHHRALRASMGASFRLPILLDEPVQPLLRTLSNLGYRTIALSPHGETDLTELDPQCPMAIVLGAEGSGLDPALESSFDLRARIPMMAGVESLGVAAAGAVAFFCLFLASRDGRRPDPAA
jgi:RNA methyltransferase, TrmH family